MAALLHLQWKRWGAAPIEEQRGPAEARGARVVHGRCLWSAGWRPQCTEPAAPTVNREISLWPSSPIPSGEDHTGSTPGNQIYPSRGPFRASKGVAYVFPVLVFASLAIGVLSGPTYNVAGYGAKGDGRMDDTLAFMAAWNAACTDSKARTSVLVPAGKTFLLSAVSFKGPCKSSIHVQIDGTILAPNKTWILKKGVWIDFMFIKGLTINGSGVIDGQGAIWWHCRAQKQCARAPVAFYIGSCTHVRLTGLSFKNSPMMHVCIHNTVGANLTKLNISAPADSPNTDGVHIERSQEVQITHSTIGTGDDCISIGNGTYNINISRIDCGPGHGISIGSLGRDGSIAQVEQIHVSSCNFYNTTNGARIKTW
ncbi:probable polygalacturonase At3g15720 isoform X2 [Phoenix dactylifera]|nr:probable polygalacturonase At3g15720 isoform X2 [Phoenix dactylifera]